MTNVAMVDANDQFRVFVMFRKMFKLDCHFFSNGGAPLIVATVSTLLRSQMLFLGISSTCFQIA